MVDRLQVTAELLFQEGDQNLGVVVVEIFQLVLPAQKLVLYLHLVELLITLVI